MLNTGYILTIYHVILGIAALAITGFLFFINRFGLDLSDESFYAIGYAFKTEPVVASTQFHLLYKKTFGFLNLTLVQIRDFRLIAHVISSLLLTKGIVDFLKIPKEPFHQRISVGLFIIIGAYVSYDFGPLTFSYNTISAVVLSSIAGIWLTLASKSHWNINSGIMAIALGFLLGIAFYNKFTNAVILVLVVPAGDIVNRYISVQKINWQLILKQWLSYLIGFISCVLWFTNYQLGIIGSLKNFYTNISGRSGDSHSFEKLIDNYIDNLEFLNENTWSFYLPLIIIILIARILSKWVNKNTLDKALAVITFSVCLYFVIENSSYIGGTYRKYSIFNIYYIVYISTLVYWIAFSKISSKHVAFMLLFFAFPFTGAVGTNNGFTAQFLFYMPFVFAAIHLFLLTGNLILNATIKCGLGILVLFQLYYGTVKFNYRQAPIEFDKMENHELSPFLSGLKTHKEMLTLKSDLAFLKNYELSNLFLFSTEGGISLLTELEPVPFGWLQPGKESNACGVILENDFPEAYKYAFIIPETAEIGPELADCLRKKGIDFYADFELKRSIAYFNNAYKKEQILSVYLHKKSRSLEAGFIN